ncbi:type-1 angiotensin II receptor-like isoform X2 [Panonychus citri]|uniref:type-1 angiotensin II receptor-like isoform X2 n=1 Tax=Panonychus citri TaxID=50023 RepID=UPI0023075214|nr:type-1 angiotensin II receptor-like isoform X2 [Panonychus citri]
MDLNYPDLENSTSSFISYDYDLDTSLNTYDYYDLVPTALIYGITLITGLIGNGLIIYTVSHFRRMRTLSNVFLASLASADLLLIIVCVPVKFGQLFSFSWEFGPIPCKFVHYMQNVSAICSVYTLTAMSIERYYAILHPVRSRYMCTMSHTRMIIILTWIFSLISASPILHLQVHVEVGERYKAFWCYKDPSQTVIWKLYEFYMFTLILVIPCIVMGFTYSCICKNLWIVVQKRATMFGHDNGTIELKNSETMSHDRKLLRTEQNSFSNKQHSIKNSSIQEMYSNKADDDTAVVKQVIKMLVAVVILFILCWSPILIINLLTAFGTLHQLNYGYLKPLRTAAHLLSYLNSCINPLVYGFMSKNFRASFKAALQKCLPCRSKGNQRTPSNLLTEVNY